MGTTNGLALVSPEQVRTDESGAPAIKEPEVRATLP